MKILAFVLYLTIGEWLETNALGIIVAAVGWGTSAAVLIWKLSRVVRSSEETAKKVDALTQAFDEQRDDLHAHTMDSSVHTTFEQRQAINARFDKIESSMEAGHARIEAKLDRWAERIMSK